MTSRETVRGHVAIIMDGNGRWAKNQGKLRISGHKAGVKSVRRAVSFAVSNNLEALTLYAFSSENWSRPAQEVTALMETVCLGARQRSEKPAQTQCSLTRHWRYQPFSPRIQERIRRSETLTANNSGPDAQHCCQLWRPLGYYRRREKTG
ncbi:polyprenyl diphosphate synthase [Pantoea vagans]|uniref:polyprenyl diphosphate synthase n=1 Tax=Pantoea vagans TaxID=470934 RepID=UPI00211CD7BC|nr:polyprenyl diphosphate synthase [Pantoea vagans]